MKLSIREMEQGDIPKIVSYFVDADSDFLRGMGADISKLPTRQEWIDKLHGEMNKSYELKEYYYVVWLADGEAVGHSNINNIDFGNTATMHLHLWNRELRKQGLGSKFLRMTIPRYFKHFHLTHLICEPKADNAAPNHTLIKLGFNKIRTYETTPGWINFHQTVTRYQLQASALDNWIN